MTVYSRIVRPRAAVTRTLSVRDVARAYNYPVDRFTGAGAKVGIIELGGGFAVAEVDRWMAEQGLKRTGTLQAKGVGGGRNAPDGPAGADGEVLLDIEVVLGVAPDADVIVYFAPNTDAGFLAAVKQGRADGCDALSISWGAPESAWTKSTMLAFDKEFAACRAAGVIVTVAAGDNGSGDGAGDGKAHADFPASSPNVLACGGTELVVDGTGARVSEVTWDLNDQSSATGGGASAVFPGRNIPDVAGNASPNSGYQILVDGESASVGGTSAVAPLYAGLIALLTEALGDGLGRRVDLLNTIVTNPGVCFDVTIGDNGAYRAGIGRDQVTGFGVVDGGRLLAVLTDGIADPAPIGTTPAPLPAPIPAPAPVPVQLPLPADVITWAKRTAAGKCWNSKADKKAARELLDLLGA